MTERRPGILAAVLLAGGASRRFGDDNKLLAPVDGGPMLAKVAREILAGDVGEIVVVTGAGREAYAEALSGLRVRFVHNDRWEQGLGGSVATGVGALSADCAGVFIVPGDLPGLSASVFRRLAAAFELHHAGRIVVPVTPDGGQRNPVLWPRRLFPALAALSGEKGGKSLLDRYAQERLDVIFEDPAAFADIDTPADYARHLAGDPE